MEESRTFLRTESPPEMGKTIQVMLQSRRSTRQKGVGCESRDIGATLLPRQAGKFCFWRQRATGAGLSVPVSAVLAVDAPSISAGGT